VFVKKKLFLRNKNKKNDSSRNGKYGSRAFFFSIGTPAIFLRSLDRKIPDTVPLPPDAIVRVYLCCDFLVPRSFHRHFYLVRHGSFFHCGDAGHQDCFPLSKDKVKDFYYLGNNREYKK
jgi:hypothetical protein